MPTLKEVLPSLCASGVVDNETDDRAVIGGLSAVDDLCDFIENGDVSQPCFKMDLDEKIRQARAAVAAIRKAVS